MRQPSKKTLKTSGFDPKIHEIISEKWNNWKWNPLTCLRAILHLIPDSDGVETIRTRKGVIHYINMGETYANTILWYGKSFRVGDWGTIVEQDGDGQ